MRLQKIKKILEADYKSAPSIKRLYILYKEEFCANSHNNKEYNIYKGKEPEIALGFLRIENLKLAKGYKAGERSNEGSCSADINSQKKRMIIRCKSREQN